MNPYNNPRLMFRGLDGSLWKGSSSQASSTSAATTVNDSRVGVADQGVYAAGGSQVTQGNDFRTFDDHSSFSVQTSTSTANSNNDNRTFDDHSSFTAVTEDNRDFSDHSSFSTSSVDNSVTNITTADPEVARAAAEAAGRSAEASERVATAGLSSAVALTKESTRLFEAAIGFGESVTSDSFRNSNAVTEAGFGAVTDANRRSLEFASSTQEQTGSLIGDLFTKALTAVTGSADADRAFASEFTGRIFDTAKSADQANVEKIIKAVVWVVGIIAGAIAARFIFGRKS